MRVVVLGAETGGGHKSVMKAISNQFKSNNIDVEEYPSFYEDLYESNRILSNFYNMSQARSMKLGVLLNEIMVMEGKQQQERLYDLYLDSLIKFFSTKCDIIISVSSLINYHIIRFFKERRVNYIAPIYIVVTDPYNPMYPGFDVIGATKYFCPTRISKEQLVKEGITPQKIFTFGYPVKSEFVFSNHSHSSFENTTDKIVIMINCGASGSFSFIELIIDLVENAVNVQFLVVCGKNKVLYTTLKHRLSNIGNCTVYAYVDNIINIYNKSDICITKPGANAIFESLLTNTIPIVYDFDGLMYQEQGVHKFLRDIVGIDISFSSLEYLKNYIINDLDQSQLIIMKEKIKSYKQSDASYEIVKVIIRDNIDLISG